MDSRKLMIDFLVPLAGRGGVENVLNSVAVFLLEQGYSVRVIQLIYSDQKWLNEKVPFFPFKVNSDHIEMEDFSCMYQSFLSENGVPDVVIATPWPYLTYAAYIALKKFSKPCKIISWLHGPIEQYKSYGCGGAEYLGFADCNFVLNKKTFNSLSNLIPDKKTVLINNPIDFSKCAPLNSDKHGSDTLLFVGRLSKEKNVEIIIKALSKTKAPWKLRIIGDGGERGNLEELVNYYKLEKRVMFEGWADNPWEKVSDVSALVLSSVYEGFPLAAIEALASGIPVISTPVDGITEVIKPGVNGYLYDMNSSDSLAEVLDFISEGVLPECDPISCVESVADFSSEKALAKIEEEILNTLDKISVIIPCYNVADSIRKCLDSVIKQTISGVNIEIICVDDKSSDNTLDILFEYEKKYPELFIIVPLPENVKQGRARNIALQYASGNYVTYIDSDDYIDDRMLECLYHNALSSGCDVVECGYSLIKNGEDILPYEEAKPIIYDMDVVEHQKAYIINRGWKTGPCGRLYKKELLTNNNIRFYEGKFMEDVYFSEMLMCHMRSYYYIPERLYNYCINPNGTMATENKSPHYMDIVYVQIEIMKYILQTKRFINCQKELEVLYFSKACVEPLNIMRNNKSLISFENYQYIRDNVFNMFPNISENEYINSQSDYKTCMALKMINAPVHDIASLFDY